MRSLRRGLSRCDGFGLFLAVCNDRGARRDYIAAIDEAMPGVTVHTVVVPKDAVDLLAEVERQFDGPPEGPVMLLGLEDAIPSEGSDHPILSNLNLRRPEWPERLPKPIVFWTSEYLLGIFGRQAPDFFDWRSDTVHFPELRADGRRLLLGDAWQGGTDGSMALDDRRARIEELQSRINSLQDSDDPTAQTARTRWYSELGNHLELLGDLDQAMACHRKSLEISERLGWLQGMAPQYGNLGLIYYRRGDLDEAEAMFRKSLEINERLGRLKGAANQYGNLGLICQRRGDPDQGEAMFRKSLEINEKLGRLEGMGTDYGNLGTIYLTRGDLDQAEAMLRKSLAIDEKLGRLQGVAIQYGNLGAMYFTRADLDQAEAMFGKALAINEKLGRLEGMANQYGNLGLVYADRGEPAVARDHWTKARDLFARIGLPHIVATVQGWLDELPAQDPHDDPG